MIDTNITEKKGRFSPESRAKAAATRAANRARNEARKVGAAPKAPKPATTQLAGLTPENCPAACNAAACVFVDRPYCAHPCKGGPQGADISRPEVLSRQSEAKRILGKRKVDLRHA